MAFIVFDSKDKSKIALCVPMLETITKAGQSENTDCPASNGLFLIRD